MISFTKTKIVFLVFVTVFAFTTLGNIGISEDKVIRIDNIDFSEFNTVTEQVEYFQKQSMIALDQLEIVDYDLPPVKQTGNIGTESTSNFVWNNPNDYLTDIPPSFKTDVENLMRELIADNPILNDVSEISIGEYSQLVPESQRTQVTEDVVGLLVVQAAFPNNLPIFDWIASIAVRFDDWTIIGYSINSNLTNISSTSNLHDYIPFIPAREWVSTSYTRRVVSDEMYALLSEPNADLPLKEFASINPNLLAIVGLSMTGAIYEQGFENGIDKNLLSSCESCLIYVQGCMPPIEDAQ